MIKNRLISSLRTIITTLLYVIANIAAVYAVDYISADFTIGPWYNAVLIVIIVAIANSLFMADIQALHDENNHLYLWNRVTFH